MQAVSARVIVLLDFASMAPLEVVISWFAKSESKSVRLVEVERGELAEPLLTTVGVNVGYFR